jgi:hypothetical protein
LLLKKTIITPLKDLSWKIKNQHRKACWHTVEDSQGQKGWLFSPCALFDSPHHQV